MIHPSLCRINDSHIVEFVIFPVCALFMQYNEHENTRNTTAVHCVTIRFTEYI